MSPVIRLASPEPMRREMIAVLPPRQRLSEGACMPRYFFDIQNDGNSVTNGTGVEVQNLQIAVREAALALADMVDDMAAGVMSQESVVEIRDGADRIVAEIRLKIDLREIPIDG